MLIVAGASTAGLSAKDKTKSQTTGKADEKPDFSDLPGTPLNQVYAVVGEIPITELDIEKEIDHFKKRKGVKKDKRNLTSQVLDLLISRAIIDMVARQESITVSQERVQKAIEKELEMRNLKDEKQLAAQVKKALGISWGEYVRELRRQLKTQQVVQLRVSVPNPTPSQVEEWYKLNKDKIGNEYIFRIILKTYSNTQEELKVSRLLNSILPQARRSFAATAQKHSDHPSAKRGGLMGPMRLDELIQYDNVLAGAVAQTKPGRVSQKFRGKKGYYLLKVEKVQNISIDKIYGRIRALLHSQNESSAFAQWIKTQRKRIAVQIYYENYEEI